MGCCLSKKSSDKKIKEVQTNLLKNFILNVTLKNDVLEHQNDFQGTYEISEMVNDKPSWIFHENKKAIWYDLNDKNWSIGTLENFGTSTKALASIGNENLDPPNVPSSKWKYYISKEDVWKEVGDGEVTIKNGGKEAFISFLNEKAVKLLAIEKESSEQKIKEVQTTLSKNSILDATFRNDVLECQNDLLKIDERIKTLNKKLSIQKDYSEHKTKGFQTNIFIDTLTEIASDKKTKEVQTYRSKNSILTVTLKNDVYDCQKDFQGTYEISEMVNDMPCWILHENKKAVWYDIEDKTWAFGTLKNLGTTTSSLESIEYGGSDPPNVPGSKWRYYDKRSTRGWNRVGQDDVIIRRGDKDALLSFIQEKTAKHDLLKEKTFKNLTLTLKNNVFDVHKLCEGQYELGDILNGRPSWINHEKEQAIWYYGKKWMIGNAENLGTHQEKISSTFVNEYPDPTNVPCDKWSFYVSSWKKAGVNDVVIDGKGKPEEKENAETPKISDNLMPDQNSSSEMPVDETSESTED